MLFTSAALPVICNAAVALPLMIAAPEAVIDNMPRSTKRSTLSVPLGVSSRSMSATKIPGRIRSVSSLTFCASGTVITGASLTGVTSIEIFMIETLRSS